MISDPISPWFIAAEQLGEFIGIRFGRVPPGQTEPEWFFLRHTDFDGIGGLAARSSELAPIGLPETQRVVRLTCRLRVLGVTGRDWRGLCPRPAHLPFAHEYVQSWQQHH
jgi:hypothetical protein